MQNLKVMVDTRTTRTQHELVPPRHVVDRAGGVRSFEVERRVHVNRIESIQIDALVQQTPTSVKRKSKRAKRSLCPISDCSPFSGDPHSHAFRHHIPSLFNEKVGVEVTRKRLTALKLAATWLLGNPYVRDLVHVIDSTGLLTEEMNQGVFGFPGCCNAGVVSRDGTYSSTKVYSVSN